jgi:HPt (histidine-containing phosphotransfer) domain-containing protein
MQTEKGGASMSGEERSEIGDEPVSRAYLSRLRAEVGDTMLRRYAQAYLDLLPERLDRIGRAVVAADTAEAAHVVIELQISSEMLGARRLAALLAALETSLEAGVMPSAVQLSHVRSEARLAAPMLRAATTSRRVQP